MNKEDIIRMAREAAQGMEGFTPKVKDPSGAVLEFYERFAALVAKHTLANIDPSSFMSWQEGYEAGKQTEREVWEHKYARLQSLMDVRETQPNKPCCLAEREACAKIAETPIGEYEVVVACGTEPTPSRIPQYANWQDIAKAIRARGQA